MRLRAVILFIGCAAFVSGCGIGLCAGQDLGGCGLSTSASASPHLLLSGLSGLSIRKNDCYPVTVSAVDAAGNTMSVAATATITASSGVVLYSSLSGCQTYDSSDENNTFYLTLASPTATFYFRSDVDGAVTLSASTTADTGLSAAEEPISVAFEAFDNASGPDGVPAVAVQGSSGYIYLGGPFGTYDDVTVAHIARLDSSGVLDTSFSATGTGLNSDARSIAIQADGKIIVGGVFTSYNGTSRSRVARLNTDGSLDTSFADVGTGLNGSVVSVAVQSDGQIVVGGWFTSYNGTSRPYMARLNTDGSLDTTFAPTGTGLNNYVSALGIQPDGNIVVTGEFTSYNGTSRKKVARLTSAGALDATFAPTGTSLTWGGQGLTVQPDGKVLVWGFFTDYNATPRNYLARLNSDGTLDAGFDTSVGPNLWVSGAALQSDGKIMLTGSFASYNGTAAPYVVRLNSDATVDSSFSQTGSGPNSAINTVLVQSSGKYVLIGGLTAYSGTKTNYLVTLNSDGSLSSTTSGGSLGLNERVWTLGFFSDGDTAVGGWFTSYGGSAQAYVARVDSEGALDSTFQIGTGFNDIVYGVVMDSSEKLYIAGMFTSFNGTARGRVAKLNADGSLDTSFSTTGSGFNSNPSSIAVQADGKVLLGAGAFSAYNGTAVGTIARLNANGTLDTGFAMSGTGLNSTVSSVAVQPDQKILVGGAFTSYNGTTRNRIARLNSDGTLDTTFAQTGTGLDNGVNAIVLRSDGSMYVGGYFTAYNGASRPYVALLNSDGTVSSSMAPTGTGLNDVVNTMAIQGDRLVVGGRFTSYNGTTRTRIARLNADGSLDTTFASDGTGFNLEVMTVGVQSNSKVVVGGYFTHFGPSTANYIARLTYIGTLD